MMQREGIKRGIYILPNLFTTASLFCGFFSIVRALHSDFEAAAWAILFGGIFDFLDGRVARLTHTTSEFGLEYDSLCDLVAFGVAPAILMYRWTLFEFHKIGWLAAFVFVACGAMRLARYNVQVSDEEKKNFQGCPIPLAAYVLASYVIFYTHVITGRAAGSYLILFVTPLLGLLMVSIIRYRSFKYLDLNPRTSFFALVFFVVFVFVIASAPDVMIFILSILYVASGIIEWVLVSPKKAWHKIMSVREYFAAKRLQEVWGDLEGDEAEGARPQAGDDTPVSGRP